MAYIYILRCKDNTLYTGSTKDLTERVNKHNLGKGSKYTRGRIPVTLVYYETFDNYNDALKREYQIKRMTRLQKEKLIHQTSFTSYV